MPAYDLWRKPVTRHAEQGLQGGHHHRRRGCLRDTFSFRAAREPGQCHGCIGTRMRWPARPCTYGLSGCGQCILERPSMTATLVG